MIPRNLQGIFARMQLRRGVLLRTRGLTWTSNFRPDFCRFGSVSYSMQNGLIKSVMRSGPHDSIRSYSVMQWRI
jgi:hypothetical protein